MTINTGGTVNLGGTAQTINAVALAGGTLKSGLLNGAVTSTGGTLDSVRGGMSLTTNGGNTTVTGTNTYTGPTTVNGGLLSVNGSVVSDVTVNAGGTLGGNGIVGNTTISGGALSPGNSIGLLTVQGSLVFTAAASYMVEVSPVSADRTNVTGAATLGGATVNASFAPGTYVAKQYTILHAGGVHGNFRRSSAPICRRASRQVSATTAAMRISISRSASFHRRAQVLTPTSRTSATPSSTSSTAPAGSRSCSAR